MRTHMLKAAILILIIIISLNGYANVCHFSHFLSSFRFSGGDVKEQILAADVKKADNVLYFSLSIKNEEVEGVYTLISISKEGLITVLKEKACVPNTINQAVLYSFVQKEIKEGDENRYVLLRISRSRGVESLLSYGKSLTGEEQSFIASNKTIQQ